MGGEALVIAGHGSHLNPDSDRPVFAHAEAIRERHLFAEVRETFWKEEPALNEVLRTLLSDVVYVVPLFMSEGYFTQRIIPRELGLSHQDLDKDISYTDPVGTHESMADVIAHRAETITGDPDVGPGVGLGIIGHGTERHETSGRSTRDHAARIREADRFDEVRALFMDEEPFVEDYRSHFTSQELVFVPFFVADGYHTREDLPEDLGITSGGNSEYDEPVTVDGRQIWYSGAVGTDPRIADVILRRAEGAGADFSDNPSSPLAPESLEAAEQVHLLLEAHSVDFDGLELQQHHDGYTLTTPAGSQELRTSSDLAEVASTYDTYVTNWYYWTRLNVEEDSPVYTFLRWLERDATLSVDERYNRLKQGIDRTWGQLLITTQIEDNGIRKYTLRHQEDAAAESLQSYDRPESAIELAKFDETGEYRPLKSAPTLRRGWIFPNLSARALLRTIGYFYPVSIANWELERQGALDVTHWRETAGRQSGMFEVVKDLPNEAVRDWSAACCSDQHCLKRRRWQLSAEHEGLPDDSGRIPCREPCSLFIAGAREWVQMAEEGHDATQDTSAGTVRPADFAHPDNPYRRRYLAERQSD